MVRKKKADFEDVDNRIELMVEGDTDVGARNPIALAKQKMQIFDIEDLSPSGIQDFLSHAFEELDYEELFDPRHGSPVYYGINAARKRSKKSLSEKDDDKKSRILSKDPAEKRRGPGEIPPDCGSHQKSAEQQTQLGGNQIIYRDETANQTNQGLEFNDPVQGCIADCWLYSALASLATAETKMNTKLKLERAIPVKVYPPSDFTNSYNLTTNIAFYTDVNGDNAFYGHLKKKIINNVTKYECWASFYEKCFAGYYQKNRQPPFPQNDTPDYNSINFGSPFNALADITGYIVSDTTSGYTVDYFGTNDLPDNNAGIITKIRQKACGGVALPNTGTVIFTKKPAVAYTYLSADVVPALANRNVAPLYAYGDPVIYNCIGMPANHAFSILGLYKKNLIEYVVLRNPWGGWGTSGFFSDALKNHIAILPAFAAPWNVANPGAEGIFGLDSLTFMRYFKAFGCTVGV